VPLGRIRPVGVNRNNNNISIPFIPSSDQRKVDISVRPPLDQRILLNQMIEKQSRDDYEIHQDIINMIKCENYLFHMTAEQAIKEYPEEQELINKSVKDEWRQLLTTDDPSKLTVLKVMNHQFDKRGKKVIPSLGFSKRKINKVTLGLDKWKYRVVGGGHRQNPNDYDKRDISSPTLDHHALLLYLSTLMRIEGIEFSTADFPGAYLASDIDEEIYMIINANHVRILLQDEEFRFLRDFVRADGTILTQIQKGIYGLKQAGKLWNDKLIKILEEFGLKQLDSHECIFKMVLDNGKVLYVAAYVDDIMIATNDPSARIALINYLKKDFPDIEANVSNKQSFLGMAIEFDYVNKRIMYDNKQYIQELCAKYNIKDGSKYTYDRNFLNDSSNKTMIDTTDYKSLIMSLFYVAKRTRPEILFPVSYLATFASKPEQSHYDKGIMILRYLFKTINYKLIHRCRGQARLNAYIDASYAIHNDAKSHTGSLIFDNRNLIDASSTKHQHMNKSSTDAEVSGVHNKVNALESLRNLAIDLTGIEDPIIVYQDNKSAIHLMNEGTSVSNKAKHMKVRYFYVKEKVDDKILHLQYKSTKEMVADLLTKPLFGEQFAEFVAHIYNDDNIMDCMLFISELN
jgi:hypothetical protein